jgi:hypothetical protein
LFDFSRQYFASFYISARASSGLRAVKVRPALSTTIVTTAARSISVSLETIDRGVSQAAW